MSINKYDQTMDLKTHDVSGVNLSVKEKLLEMVGRQYESDQ